MRWVLLAMIGLGVGKKNPEEMRRIKNRDLEFKMIEALFVCEGGSYYSGGTPLILEIPATQTSLQDCEKACATRTRCRVASLVPGNESRRTPQCHLSHFRSKVVEAGPPGSFACLVKHVDRRP